MSSPYTLPVGSLSVLTSVPAGTATGLARAFPSAILKQNGYRSRSLKPPSPLMNIASATAWSAFTAATAFSSIALASWAVPVCPCCAHTAGESVRAAAASVRVDTSTVTRKNDFCIACSPFAKLRSPYVLSLLSLDDGWRYAPVARVSQENYCGEAFCLINQRLTRHFVPPVISTFDNINDISNIS